VDVTKEVDQLVQQLQVALAQASRVQMIQEQEDRSGPSYQVLMSARLGQEEQIRELTDQLQQAQQQLVALQEDQEKGRQAWIDQGVQAEVVRTRRLELEARTSARFRDFDRLALENQQLSQRVELAEASSTPASRGLARHLLSTSKKQVLDQIRVYSEDQARYSRYLMRFAEAYPSFVYWSDDDQDETEDQEMPDGGQSVEAGGVSSRGLGTTSGMGSYSGGGPAGIDPMVPPVPGPPGPEAAPGGLASAAGGAAPLSG
jgi:hypothetical protein